MIIVYCPNIIFSKKTLAKTFSVTRLINLSGKKSTHIDELSWFYELAERVQEAMPFGHVELRLSLSSEVHKMVGMKEQWSEGRAEGQTCRRRKYEAKL